MRNGGSGTWVIDHATAWQHAAQRTDIKFLDPPPWMKSSLVVRWY